MYRGQETRCEEGDVRFRSLNINLDILVLFLGLCMPPQRISRTETVVCRTHQIRALK